MLSGTQLYWNSNINKNEPVSSVDRLLDGLVETRLWDKEGDGFNPGTFEKDAAEHIKNYVYEISNFWV
jgi:hypothetical protein